MYGVLKCPGQGTLCCWLRVHIRRLQVMGSVCSTCIHVSVLPCYRVEAGAEKGSRRRSRGARTPDARHGTGDTRVSCTHGDRACFPRVHRHNTPSQLDTPTHGKHTTRRHTPGQPKVCDSVSPGGLPIKNLKGLRHTQTTRTTSQRVTALRPGYVRANCTHITSLTSLRLYFTRVAARPTHRYTTHTPGASHAPAHMGPVTWLMECEPHLPRARTPADKRV